MDFEIWHFEHKHENGDYLNWCFQAMAIIQTYSNDIPNTKQSIKFNKNSVSCKMAQYFKVNDIVKSDFLNP